MMRALTIGCLGLALLGSARARAEASPDENASGGASPRGKETPAEGASDGGPHLIDWLYLNAETGAELVGLETISVKRDVVPSAARHNDVGMFGGASAGIKLLFISVGPHFRMGHFNDWDLWTLNLDAAWVAPIGHFQPYLLISGGYARLGRAFESFNSMTVRVQGYDLRLGLGGDYFPSPLVSVGGSITGEVLGMYRSGVNLNSQDGLINDFYKFDGSSAGVGITGGLNVGLHL